MDGDLVDALTVGKASRAAIYEANLTKTSAPNNKAVRRALGFRENGQVGSKVPKFVSLEAQKLYDEVNRFATKRMPVASRDALHQAWHAATFETDFRNLAIKYGKIWAEPIHKRRLASNPASHLLVAPDKYYQEDLLWDYRKYREFIILQLEHLAFVKAIAYHYNHYVNRAQRPLIGLVQITTAETRETLKEEHRSLVVVLRLSQDKLFDVWDKYSPTAPKSRTRKRKRPRHHIGDDKVYRERRPISHADDESEDEDFPLTISTPDRGRLASLDEQNETTDIHPVATLEDGTMQGLTSTGTGSGLGNTKASSTYSSVVLNESSTQHHPRSVDAIETPYDATIAEGHRRLDSVGISEATSPRERPTSRAMSDAMLLPAEADPVSNSQRNELRLLLNCELFQHPDSHSKLDNAAAMWNKSGELDNMLCLVWEKDRKRIQQKLGEEYQNIDEMLDAWLVQCRGARILGELAGWHPLKDKPKHRQSLEQWLGQLDEDSEYAQMDFMITRFRIELEHSRIYGGDRDVVAETLTSAFATALQHTHPSAIRLFRSGITSFNKKLFSWALDS